MESGRPSLPELPVELLQILVSSSDTIPEALQTLMHTSKTLADKITTCLRTPTTLLEILSKLTTPQIDQFIETFFQPGSGNYQAILKEANKENPTVAATICYALITKDVQLNWPTVNAAYYELNKMDKDEKYIKLLGCISYHKRYIEWLEKRKSQPNILATRNVFIDLGKHKRATAFLELLQDTKKATDLITFSDFIWFLKLLPPHERMLVINALNTKADLRAFYALQPSSIFGFTEFISLLESNQDQLTAFLAIHKSDPDVNYLSFTYSIERQIFFNLFALMSPDQQWSFFLSFSEEAVKKLGFSSISYFFNAFEPAKWDTVIDTFLRFTTINLGTAIDILKTLPDEKTQTWFLDKVENKFPRVDDDKVPAYMIHTPSLFTEYFYAKLPSKIKTRLFNNIVSLGYLDNLEINDLQAILYVIKKEDRLLAIDQLGARCSSALVKPKDYKFHDILRLIPPMEVVIFLDKLGSQAVYEIIRHSYGSLTGLVLLTNNTDTISSYTSLVLFEWLTKQGCVDRLTPDVSTFLEMYAFLPRGLLEDYSQNRLLKIIKDEIDRLAKEPGQVATSIALNSLYVQLKQHGAQFIPTFMSWYEQNKKVLHSRNVLSVFTGNRTEELCNKLLIACDRKTANERKNTPVKRL